MGKFCACKEYTAPRRKEEDKGMGGGDALSTDYHLINHLCYIAISLCGRA